MIVFEYVILALAVWRLTRIVTTDEITAPLRERIWRRFPPGNSQFGYAFTCDWCISIWTASAAMTMYKISPSSALFVCSVLALSGVAGIINRII